MISNFIVNRNNKKELKHNFFEKCQKFLIHVHIFLFFYFFWVEPLSFCQDELSRLIFFVICPFWINNMILFIWSLNGLIHHQVEGIFYISVGIKINISLWELRCCFARNMNWIAIQNNQPANIWSGSFFRQLFCQCQIVDNSFCQHSFHRQVWFVDIRFIDKFGSSTFVIITLAANLTYEWLFYLQPTKINPDFFFFFW